MVRLLKKVSSLPLHREAAEVAAAAAAVAAAALRCNGRPETFFRNFTLEKVTSKIGKMLKRTA